MISSKNGNIEIEGDFDEIMTDLTILYGEVIKTAINKNHSKGGDMTFEEIENFLYKAIQIDKLMDSGMSGEEALEIVDIEMHKKFIKEKGIK